MSNTGDTPAAESLVKRPRDRQMTAEMEAALRKLNPQFGRARDSVLAPDAHARSVLDLATSGGEQ